MYEFNIYIVKIEIINIQCNYYTLGTYISVSIILCTYHLPTYNRSIHFMLVLDIGNKILSNIKRYLTYTIKI